MESFLYGGAIGGSIGGFARSYVEGYSFFPNLGDALIGWGVSRWHQSFVPARFTGNTAIVIGGAVGAFVGGLVISKVAYLVLGKVAETFGENLASNLSKTTLFVNGQEIPRDVSL